MPPSHLFSCASCAYLTFTHYFAAYDHIVHDACHAEDRAKIRRQFGLDGEREFIHRMITVLLIADTATATTIKDAARGRAPNVNIEKYIEQSNFLLQLLDPAAPADPPPPALRTRVQLLSPSKYAASLPCAPYYFRMQLSLHPVPSRAALVGAIAARFRSDWETENPPPPPVVDWTAAARACCVMTIKTAALGVVRVKIAGDGDVQRLAQVAREVEDGVWTLVIGG